MLSSIIDDTPVVVSRLSTWLDRLRLNRGLSEDPSNTPLTLDDFLLRNQITTSPSSPQIPSPPTDPNPVQWLDVLSELFNFGGSSSSSRPSVKLPRKQANPKHCFVETPLKKVVVEKRRRSEDEVEEGEKELVGFSRSEVTVIDTSFSVWKCDKVLFRRKHVWKVRDKKGKARVGLSKNKTMKMKLKKKKKKKKRKCDDDVSDGEITRKSKKMKISNNNRGYHNEEVDDDDEPESSNVNRIFLSRLPTKPSKEGSFEVHTSRRNYEREARGRRSLAE